MKNLWSQLGTDVLWKETAVLRIAVAGCFIGHGMIALQVADNYGSEWNFWIRSILPAAIEFKGSEFMLRSVGLLDVVDGILLLFPRVPRQALAWVLGWGFLTALSRLYFLGVYIPPFEVNGLHALAEFLKRTPNWIMPLLLVAMISPKAIFSSSVISRKDNILRLAVASQMLAIAVNSTYEWLNPNFKIELVKTGQPEWYFYLSSGLAALALVHLVTQNIIELGQHSKRIGTLLIAVAYCLPEWISIYSRNLPGGFFYALIRIISQFSMYASVLMWCIAQWHRSNRDSPSQITSNDAARGLIRQ